MNHVLNNCDRRRVAVIVNDMESFRQWFIDELNNEGPAVVRAFEWPSVDVSKVMAPELYEAHFIDWLGATKEAARARAREFLTENGCLDRFNRLSEQCEHQQVMPFKRNRYRCDAGLCRTQ